MLLWLVVNVERVPAGRRLLARSADSQYHDRVVCVGLFRMMSSRCELCDWQTKDCIVDVEIRPQCGVLDVRVESFGVFNESVRQHL